MFTGMRNSLSPSLGVSLAILMLYGCTANQPQLQLAQAAEAEEKIEYRAGELNQESLLELLTAELAGQQRDFDTAYELYLRQAKLNGSADLAARATRIAQFKRDPDAVIEAGQLWLDIEPSREEPAQILINILLHESRFDEALSLLRDQPEINAELLIVVESLLDNYDDQSAAELSELLGERLNARPEQLDLLLVQAKTLAKLQKNDEALSLLDQGLKIDPLQPDLVVQKAQLLRSFKQNPAAALKLIERTLPSNTDHRQLRAVHVQLLLELKPDSVEQAVNNAIQQAERDPQLIYYYALLLMENDQPNLSRNLFNELLERDPARTDLNLYLGIIEESLGNKEAALAAFANVETGDALLNAITRTLMLLDPETELERARSLTAAAEASDPERANQASIIFARWANDAGLRQVGVDYLSEKIIEQPNDVALLYSRALMIEPLNSAQMMEDLERAYALNPDNAGTQNALGYSLLEHSTDYQRAYELIKLALAESPDDPAYLDSMGWALHKLERNEEALEYLERAYKLMQDPEVASHLIIVLAELGQIERATEILSQQLEEHPGNADIEEAQRWLER